VETPGPAGAGSVIVAGMNALIGGLQVDAETATTLNRILSEFGPSVDSNGDFSRIGLNFEIPLVALPGSR
jgi:hypothetical protein